MPITKATASAIAPAAKGDLVVGSATNDAAVLGVGSANQVLTVDSSTTTGLKWASPASSFPESATNTVATSETYTAGSYGNLATTGPSVTLTTGTKALVIITARIIPLGAHEGFASFEVTGASSVSPSDATALRFYGLNTTNVYGQMSAAYLTTLTAGSNTFTVKYRSGSTDGTSFRDRSIIVINLA